MISTVHSISLLIFLLTIFILGGYASPKGSFYTDTTVYHPKKGEKSNQDHGTRWYFDTSRDNAPPFYPKADSNYKRYRGRGLSGPSSNHAERLCISYPCTPDKWMYKNTKTFSHSPYHDTNPQNIHHDEALQTSRKILDLQRSIGQW